MAGFTSSELKQLHCGKAKDLIIFPIWARADLEIQKINQKAIFYPLVEIISKLFKKYYFSQYLNTIVVTNRCENHI